MDAYYTHSPVIQKLNKDIREASKLMSRQEVRCLVGCYYDMQKDRIGHSNRLFQATHQEIPHQSIQWLFDQSLVLEKQVGKMLDYYSGAHPVGLWMRENKGIGPIIAAGFLAYIDITRAPTAGRIWSYTGYVPDINWHSAETNRTKIKEHFTDWELKPSTVLSTEQVYAILDFYKRNPENIFESFKDEETGKYNTITFGEMATYLAKPPFNPNMKLLAWKLGESFVKVGGSEEPNYGHLIHRRKIYEKKKNEAGEYKELADRLLREKNWDKSTSTYKALVNGKLSDGHIHSRSKRWAVKIFLSHLHHIMYVHHYGKLPPRPFALEHLGHVDYIPPFVPFEDFVTVDNKE